MTMTRNSDPILRILAFWKRSMNRSSLQAHRQVASLGQGNTPHRHMFLLLRLHACIKLRCDELTCLHQALSRPPGQAKQPGCFEETQRCEAG